MSNPQATVKDFTATYAATAPVSPKSEWGKEFMKARDTLLVENIVFTVLDVRARARDDKTEYACLISVDGVQYETVFAGAYICNQLKNLQTVDLPFITRLVYVPNGRAIQADKKPFFFGSAIAV